MLGDGKDQMKNSTSQNQDEEEEQQKTPHEAPRMV